MKKEKTRERSRYSRFSQEAYIVTFRSECKQIKGFRGCSRRERSRGIRSSKEGSQINTRIVFSRPKRMMEGKETNKRDCTCEYCFNKNVNILDGPGQGRMKGAKDGRNDGFSREREFALLRREGINKLGR